MKRILYCMHIGWNWIKQRPHYIAIELSKHYDVTVISDHSYRVKAVSNSESETDHLHIKEFYKIPLFDHVSSLSHINYYLRSLYYKYYIRTLRPEYVYVMKPQSVYALPKDLADSKLIYDCMDDMVAFAENEVIRRKVFDAERELIRRADVIFASSEHLKDILIKRYQIGKDVPVIRNAYNGEILNEKYIKKSNADKEEFTLCYFGTVAEWFNFDFVLRSLNDIPNLSYLIVGPVQSGTSVPQYERLKYIGPVQHDDLPETVKDVDAFVMPFKVTKLIKSVDPVKLYEYINFDKNILCVEYPEVERFKDFAYFYSDYESFKNQIQLMMSNRSPKYTNGQRIEFLNVNTWKKRVEAIQKCLESL